MKKILIVALCTVMAVQTFAQLEKGDWLIGGRLGFKSSSQEFNGEDYKYSSFKVAPDVGYFVAPSLAFGIDAKVEFNKEDDPFGEYNWTEYSVGPFVRYYFLPRTNRLNLFAQGSYTFGGYKDDDNSYSFNKYALRAGPAYFIRPCFALEFTVGYGSRKWEDEDSRENTISFNAGFQIHLQYGGGMTQIDPPAN